MPIATPVYRRSDTILFRDVNTPVGNFQLAARKNGLCALRFPQQQQWKKGAIATDEHPANSILTSAADWLQRYLARECPPPFSPIDFEWCTEFGHNVYRTLLLIPVGTTITYGELARKVGRPACARAVGSWMRKNPVPIFVPCHRVIPQRGGIGGWSGPRGMKERLLALEGVPVTYRGPNRNRMD